MTFSQLRAHKFSFYFIFSPSLFHSQYFFMIISLNIFPTQFSVCVFLFSALMTHHESLKATRDFYKHIKVGQAIGCRMECECGRSQTLRSISSRLNSISIIQFSLCRKNERHTRFIASGRASSWACVVFFLPPNKPKEIFIFLDIFRVSGSFVCVSCARALVVVQPDGAESHFESWSFA